MARCFLPGMCMILKFERQCFFFEVEETRVFDVLEFAIAEYFQEWSVTHGNNQVITSEDKIPGSFKSVSYCQCLPFNWGIPRFCRMGKMTADEGHFPSMWAAERCITRAGAVFLQQEEPNAIF